MLDELLGIIDGKVFPTTRQSEGSAGGMVLVDRSTGKVIAITLWDTEESMRADQTGKLLQQRISEVSRHITSVMISERYEIVSGFDKEA
jgi:hypothetical protein